MKMTKEQAVCLKKRLENIFRKIEKIKDKQIPLEYLLKK